MILDVLKSRKNYSGLDLKFDKAFKFLEENDAEKLPVGKYPIDGDNVYALVQEYTTKTLEQCRFETHRKFIDIQFIVKGTEVIGWAPLDSMDNSAEYNPEKDITFYKTPENWTASTLTDSHFAVYFPEDAHMPCISSGPSKDVKKVVIKIKL